MEGALTHWGAPSEGDQNPARDLPAVICLGNSIGVGGGDNNQRRGRGGVFSWAELKSEKRRKRGDEWEVFPQLAWVSVWDRDGLRGHRRSGGLARWEHHLKLVERLIHRCTRLDRWGGTRERTSVLGTSTRRLAFYPQPLLRLFGFFWFFFYHQNSCTAVYVPWSQGWWLTKVTSLSTCPQTVGAREWGNCCVCVYVCVRTRERACVCVRLHACLNHNNVYHWRHFIMAFISCQSDALK